MGIFQRSSELAAAGERRASRPPEMGSVRGPRSRAARSHCTRVPGAAGALSTAVGRPPPSGGSPGRDTSARSPRPARRLGRSRRRQPRRAQATRTRRPGHPPAQLLSPGAPPPRGSPRAAPPGSAAACATAGGRGARPAAHRS